MQKLHGRETTKQTILGPAESAEQLQDVSVQEDLSTCLLQRSATSSCASITSGLQSSRLPWLVPHVLLEESTKGKHGVKSAPREVLDGAILASP